MFDAFTKVVAQADARGEFLNAGQIDALAAMVAESNKRMDAVNRITSNASKIVTNAARDLFDQQPALIAPGGNAYTHRRMAACLRDMEIVLRYITYAVFTGDASVLEDRCLNGLRETYLALGVPGASVAEGIRKMKDAAIAIANDRNGITPGDCSALMSEIGTYFDRAAAAVAGSPEANPLGLPEPRMIGVLRQTFPLEGQAAGPEQQRIKAAGPGRCRKQRLQQRQQRIAGAQARAQFGNGLSPVPGPRPLQQHRTAGQVQPAPLQLGPQRVVGPAITDLQPRQTAHQLAAQGKVAAEGAAAVVHEREGHCAILAMAAPMP